MKEKNRELFLNILGLASKQVANVMENLKLVNYAQAMLAFNKNQKFYQSQQQTFSKENECAGLVN